MAETKIEINSDTENKSEGGCGCGNCGCGN